MGCKFCASTIGGLKRGLRASEMLDQIYAISRDTGERVSNVVVMGIGEPLDNYDNLIRFIKLITDENGLNISQRNITVSTCGIVENMRRLADENLQITLSLSLHGATQEKRRELMPIADKYKLDKVMDACVYYFEKTGRRITFEYSLAAGINDTREDARSLGRLLGSLSADGLRFHVNLIPMNPINESSCKEPPKKRVDDFKEMLEKKRINVTIRRELGRDIDGACGQLRQSYQKSKT